MNLEDMRRHLERSWESLDASFLERKDSHGALVALTKLYRHLNPHEQQLANRVVCEWLTEAGSRRQFDALALVDEFRILEALPILRSLEGQAERRTDHEAPYDWARINRIIGRLAESG